MLADRFARGLRQRTAIEDGSRPKAMIDVLPWWDIESNGWPMLSTSLAGDRLWVSPDFVGLVERALKRNPIIFAATEARMALFSEVRFQFRQLNEGRPGKLFGNPDLAPLEKPWPGGTTGDLLAIAEGMNSCAGNFFAAKIGDQIKPLRPDFVTMIIDSPGDDPSGPWSPEAEVLGYAYLAPGRSEPHFFLPEEVVHYMPIPDPEVPWRGMSWIGPVIEDLLADQGMTSHKRKFLEAGGTPNYVVKVPAENIEKFDEWVDKFEERREGSHGNGYKTLFLAAAADVQSIGSNLAELEFQAIQAAGEVRIAAAARTHPALLGLSDALKGSALNAGNLKEVRRIFASMVLRPMWRNFAGSIARIINVPPNAELWYDDRDIPALQEDQTERAEALSTEATAVFTLVQAGYEPDAAVEAVVAGDLAGLVGHHSGLTSVQLQPPGDGQPVPPAGNGNAKKIDRRELALAIDDLARRGQLPFPTEES